MGLPSSEGDGLTISPRHPISRNPCKAAYRPCQGCGYGPESRFQVRISYCRDDDSLWQSATQLFWAYQRVSFDRRSIVATGARTASVQDALSFAHRARAAVEAASLRCCPVILAARRLPPILPPLRPIWAMSCDTTDLVNFGSAGFSAGLSPVSLLTARMPAWNSSSGAVRERFCIRLQRGMFRRRLSSPWKFKVAHYQKIGRQPLPPVGGAVPLDPPWTWGPLWGRRLVPLPDAEAGASAPARAPAPHHFARDLRLSQGDTHYMEYPHLLSA